MVKLRRTYPCKEFGKKSQQMSKGLKNPVACLMVCLKEGIQSRNASQISNVWKGITIEPQSKFCYLITLISHIISVVLRRPFGLLDLVIKSCEVTQLM